MLFVAWTRSSSGIDLHLKVNQWIGQRDFNIKKHEFCHWKWIYNGETNHTKVSIYWSTGVFSENYAPYPKYKGFLSKCPFNIIPGFNPLTTVCARDNPSVFIHLHQLQLPGFTGGFSWFLHTNGESNGYNGVFQVSPRTMAWPEIVPATPAFQCFELEAHTSDVATWNLGWQKLMVVSEIGYGSKCWYLHEHQTSCCSWMFILCSEGPVRGYWPIPKACTKRSNIWSWFCLRWYKFRY